MGNYICWAAHPNSGMECRSGTIDYPFHHGLRSSFRCRFRGPATRVAMFQVVDQQRGGFSDMGRTDHERTAVRIMTVPSAEPRPYYTEAREDGCMVTSTLSARLRFTPSPPFRSSWSMRYPSAQARARGPDVPSQGLHLEIYE